MTASTTRALDALLVANAALAAFGDKYKTGAQDPHLLRLQAAADAAAEAFFAARGR